MAASFLCYGAMAHAQESAATSVPEEQPANARAAAASSLIESAKQAADPENPALLPPHRNKTLQELEERWQKMQGQAKAKNLSTVVNQNILTTVATHAGCDDITGVMPAGVPFSKENKLLLNGATLFAKCGPNNYAVISTYAVDAQGGKSMIVPSSAFTSKIGNKVARKMYYKSTDGNEYTTLSVLENQRMISLEFWSKDDSRKKNIVNRLKEEILFSNIESQN